MGAKAAEASHPDKVMLTQRSGTGLIVQELSFAAGRSDVGTADTNRYEQFEPSNPR